MDLSLTPDQELLRNTARDVLERELPLTRVHELDDEEERFDRALWSQLAELGWSGILVPAEHGGAGNSFADAGVLCEEMGRALVPSAFFSTAIFGALVIRAAGTPAQRERLLPRLGSGDLLVALALTEPDYGWGPARVQTRATRQNEDLVLDGVKLFVPDAHVADVLVCAVRTERDPDDGLALVLVDRDAPGLTCRSVTGWDGIPMNEVRFEGVTVPPDNVMGESGRGWELLAPALDQATILLSAYMVGGTARALEMGIDYSRDRVQFGSPIGTFPRVQDHLIDAVTALDGARWTTNEALWKLDTGRPAAEAASVAKVAASEAYREVCYRVHEVHAAIGISKEYGLYLYTKMARTLYHYLGDPTHHRRRLARLLADGATDHGVHAVAAGGNS